MGYILFLLIAIGAILSLTLQSNPLAKMFEKTKASFVEYVTPRTQTEVIIDNLKPSHEALERFFTKTAPNVMKSQNLSPQEQQELESAVEAFAESQQAIEEIRQAERAETSVTETIIKKVLSIDPAPAPSPSSSNSPAPSASQTPQITPVPPYCRVEC